MMHFGWGSLVALLTHGHLRAENSHSDSAAPASGPPSSRSGVAHEHADPFEGQQTLREFELGGCIDRANPISAHPDGQTNVTGDARSNRSEFVGCVSNEFCRSTVDSIQHLGPDTGGQVSEDATESIETPGRNASNATGLRFIRIQKTGGTTFGESIMPRFCKPKHLCQGLYHLDWNRAKKDWDGPVVTLLRDPVERTMSEIMFIRTYYGRTLSREPQWNFANKSWLARVQRAQVDEAIDIYLHGNPKSPSFNRQSLYLLGFREELNAGEEYSWNKDHDELLAKAKDHLDQLQAFGISDCYTTSMRVIARKLGWPAEKVITFAKRHHDRQQNKTTAFMRISKDASFREGNWMTVRNFAAQTPQSSVVSCGPGTWRTSASPALVDAIERANAVDVELFRFAKARFQERFGEEC